MLLYFFAAAEVRVKILINKGNELPKPVISATILCHVSCCVKNINPATSNSIMSNGVRNECHVLLLLDLLRRLSNWLSGNAVSIYALKLLRNKHISSSECMVRMPFLIRAYISCVFLKFIKPSLEKLYNNNFCLSEHFCQR